MNKTVKKTLIFLMCLVSVCLIFISSAFALEWEGSSGGGAGHGTPADCKGFAVRRYPSDNCLGYRFSVVDKGGNNKTSKVIDVFRNDYYGNYAYGNTYKFTTKMNKKQLINAQNSGFSTKKTSVNCYKESELDFITALSTPDTMATWQAYNGNLNIILDLLGVGTIADLENGDKVLVEPLYDVRLETIYHSCTETELALYGKYLLGEDSDGGTSSTAASWGFISVCTNKLYANLLYTEDGQGLWSDATELTKRTTFKKIINYGYGVGIAYTETKDEFTPELDVQKVQAWEGTAYTKNNQYGVSTGYGFSYYTCYNGYPANGDTVFFTVFFTYGGDNYNCRQTVWIDDTQVAVRTGKLLSNLTYNVVASSPVVDNDKRSIRIDAQIDYIDDEGNTLKYGMKESFYIPVQPNLNREKVSLLNINGEVVAFAGCDSSFGSVYVGQKVQPKYTFTATNEWFANVNLYATALKWSNGKWTSMSSDGGYDLNKKSWILASSVPDNTVGSLGYTVVPDNSASGSEVMRFQMASEWTTDTARTAETSVYEIPVIKADVELAEIKLVDASGNYVSPSSLESGQQVTVRYVYKNNSSVTVFVDGYNNSESLMNTDGAYAINAGESIETEGETITVSSSSFTVWGGVYLNGAGLKNTDWESNGTNNEKTLTCSVKKNLSGLIVTPNASYRETTEVITSFYLYNDNATDVLPTDGVTATVQIKNTKTNAVIKTFTLSSLCVPANDKNLYYVKWKVPTGLNGGDVTVTLSVYRDKVLNSTDVQSYPTVTFATRTVPDTSYTDKAPDGFTVPAEPKASTRYVGWYQYTYANGKFTKKSCVIVLSFDDIQLNPATGKTHTKSSKGVWTMRSGYGVSLSVTCSVDEFAGSLYDFDYTLPQYAYACFPEFGYAETNTTCQMLEYVNSKWCFQTNGNYGRVHFTPLYYPDGEYKVYLIFSDMWTPGGMVSYARLTNTLKLSGNVYDDWYIGR